MFGYNNFFLQEDLVRISEGFKWSVFENKNVLITGANGHIASYLAFAFAFAVEHKELNAKIIVVSRDKERLERLYKPFWGKEWFNILAADVCEVSIQGLEVDYIFHFAGNASPYFIANDPVGILRANIVGVFNIAEIARRNLGSKIVYASTREVYGENKSDRKLTETSFGNLDPLDPRSCYPESKRAAETVLEAYRRQYGIRYGIARVAHCYGPGMKLANDGRVMSDFLNDALNHQDIVLNSDGGALRAFCYISDVIIGLLIIASHESDNDVYNLSNETEEISILDLAKTIALIIPNINISIESKVIDSAVYCNYKRKPLDCSKLIELGWYPQIALKEGLEWTIKSFEKL